MVYEALIRELRDLCERTWDSFGMLVIELRAENLRALVSRLRDEFGFGLFRDVTAMLV